MLAEDWLTRPAEPGGVASPWRGAKVDPKWLFRPVSSLGSGSVKGSRSACCAWNVSCAQGLTGRANCATHLGKGLVAAHDGLCDGQSV